MRRKRSTLEIEQAGGATVRIEVPFFLGPKLRRHVVRRVQLYGLGGQLAAVVDQIVLLASVHHKRRQVRFTDGESAEGREFNDVS